MREFDLIDWIRRECDPPAPDVLLGIGDDAAILRLPPGEDLLVSTDTLVAGVHFPWGTAAFDIGWKALAVNLSDIAAMAGKPRWASLALTLPTPDHDWLHEFMRGFLSLARAQSVSLIGGDTTRGPLSITVTIHGSAAAGRALRRDGARAGDALVLVGDLGWAGWGLRQAQAIETEQRVGLAERLPDPRFVLALNRPQPKCFAAEVLRQHAHALIDVSDGLLADLGHVLRASCLGATVQLDAISSLTPLRALAGDELATQLTLCAGDDYALLAAVPTAALAPVLALDRPDCPVRRIGEFEAATGIRLQVDGRPLPLPATSGWDHFA